ncbi:MAG TPA: VOC family protein [Hypericibacter adhaerens]|jgi:catechol 2,3-dioxygenase-like lactoylglutathione lyase family enzyme|uniref:Lactoylglutathione lyase n=1 Tax=Hypericibacter adhaerens TaxID=2602016 RepID=A0A5J6N3M6_9PROT|nr:VOC family protein [Hypericibacter adhaerens]QEX24632.1 lactoylglutathione lyase [Hypericibacter adhaerens]HWA45843.1 VOC family protein [Hypericibacter adhaerens]
MLAYIMVGTNNVKKAAKFYDAALAPLGLVRTGDGGRYIGYGPKKAPDKAQFFVTKPYNRKAATFGNGTMISLVAKSRKAVDGFYAAALAQGGKDEGKPGPRPADGSNYAAYVRDLDGNKICAYCSKAK